MRHSQSHLISLATLLQNAEARASAIPPSAPSAEGGSGLIDILAMQRRAKEERENAEPLATMTPVPMVADVRGTTTDPDFVAALAAAGRKKKRIALGAIAGVLVLAAIGFGFRGSHATGAAASAAIVAAPPPQVVTPPPAPAPSPVVAATVATPAAPVASAPTPPAPIAAAPPAHKGKGRKASHGAKAKGPKLTKVTSSGVAP